MNIAIIDDVQQDLDALAEATREHYDQRQISIQSPTTSSTQHHKLKEKMERNLFAGSFHCVKI